METSHSQSEVTRPEDPEPLVFEHPGKDSAENGESRQQGTEPPSVPPPHQSVHLGTALRWYPLLALLPIVVLTAAGITLGLRRHPVYSASTMINVGTLDVAAQATPGYAEAAVTLASAYSRQVNSQFVYRPVAKTLRLSLAEVSSRLSSSAVPDSPTFTINATGPSPRSAITLAGAATNALRHYVNVVDQGANSSTRLLDRYRDAERKADLLASASGSLSGKDRVLPGSVSRARLEAAKLDAEVARLQADALASQYTSSSTSIRGAIIQVLNPATSASSDRNSITERYALIGAAAGVVLGAALALLVANLRRRDWPAEPGA